MLVGYTRSKFYFSKKYSKNKDTKKKIHKWEARSNNEKYHNNTKINKDKCNNNNNNNKNTNNNKNGTKKPHDRQFNTWFYFYVSRVVIVDWWRQCPTMWSSCSIIRVSAARQEGYLMLQCQSSAAVLGQCSCVLLLLNQFNVLCHFVIKTG